MSEIFETVKRNASLTDYAKEHLTTARAGGEFICPNCNSGGSGKKDSDSGFFIDEKKGFHCFVCNFEGDIFDLCAKVEHLEPQSREVLERVAEFAGVSLEGYEQGASSRNGKRKTAAARKEDAAKLEAARAKQRAYIKRTQANLTDPAAVAYIEARGYTVEQLQAIGAGYDPNYKNKGEKRLILPYMGADYYWIARDITGEAEGHKYEKTPKYTGVGSEPLYNAAVIQNAPCVYIVEGIFDMLALNLLGVENIIPIIGNGNATSHLEAALKKTDPAPCICLALDDDDVGKDTQAKVKKRLEQMHVAVVEIDTSQIKGKDADEKRLNDPQALKEKFQAAGAYAIEHKKEIIIEQDMKALQEIGLKNSFQTLREIETLENEPHVISSGIPKLDALLWGGFEPSLIVLGATSSTGKTTLITQIADHMAENKNPVLFVSIEQSAEELTAKSLSRISLERVGVDTRNYQDAIAVNHIRHKAGRKCWKEDKYQLFAECLEEYRTKIAKYLHYFAPNEQPDIQKIKTVVQTLTEYHSRPPVVFVDYLQLLAAQSDRDSDKQAVDKNISALRRLARDFKTPVIAISSLNRGSYSGVVSAEAFKESGGIEYSADILLGLQPSSLAEDIKRAGDDQSKEKKRAKESYSKFKKEDTREITLTVLKNRNGKVDETGFELTFHSLHSKLQPHD